MLEKVVQIGNQELKLKATAAIPRMYRNKFGRDLFVDFRELEKSYNENVGKAGSELTMSDFEMFENIAYIMAKHADPTAPEDIEAWLEGYEMFDIYTVLPEIFEIWSDCLKSMVQPKKNGQPQSGR